MAVDVYIGLGSNIAPARHLRAACDQLARELGPLEHSSAYRSPPHGFSGDDFLNSVARFSSRAAPAEIEAVLSRIEDRAGRSADRGGSRTLDLDLLLYGQRVAPAERLPRGDVLAYPFVLAPLAEIAPDVVHPVTGERFAAAWRRMAARQPRLTRIGPVETLA